MDFEQLATTLAKLQTDGVVQLCISFERNLSRADILRAAYYHLVMPEFKASLEIKKLHEVIVDWNKQGLRRTENMDEELRAMQEEADRRIRADKEGFVKYLADGARDRISDLQDHFPEFKVWLKAVRQSALLAAWSAFESLATDLWIFAVNSRPSLFATKVLDGFHDNLPEGMSSKAIPLGILAKYRFNISAHIGDIVSAHVKFSSLKELRKAYTVSGLLDDDTNMLMQTDDLRMLSHIRNLIAHRNALVDASFKRVTHCTEEIGDEFVIADDDLDKYIGLVERLGSGMLKSVDSLLLAQ